MHYVIIGNSAAAIGAVTGIRTVDTEGKITLISDETHHTYSRPLISYWLQGKVVDKNMIYRDKDFYKKNKVDTILGKKVVKIDSDKSCVILADDSTVSYDKLLVATGSSPFVPPIEGLDSVKEAYTFLDWDTVKNIKAKVTKDSSVVILGAGLIGLKAAEGLSKTVKEITVIDLADRVLPSILDTKGASMVQKNIEKKGVKFILNDAAANVTANSLKLKSGKEVSFDLLIIAVGVRPNTSLIKDINGTVNRAIITDDYQKTSIDNIYAAGDCTESMDISSNQSKVLALLPNAYMQGEIAGINMAGGNQRYENAIPMNAIGFFGLHMITAGSLDGECEVYTDKQNYRKFVFGDGLLKGYMLIGDIDRAGIYTSLIREQIPLSSVDIDLLKNSPQLLIFDKNTRKQKLAGGQ